MFASKQNSDLCFSFLKFPKLQRYYLIDFWSKSYENVVSRKCLEKDLAMNGSGFYLFSTKNFLGTMFWNGFSGICCIHILISDWSYQKYYVRVLKFFLYLTIFSHGRHVLLVEKWTKKCLFNKGAGKFSFKCIWNLHPDLLSLWFYYIVWLVKMTYWISAYCLVIVRVECLFLFSYLSHFPFYFVYLPWFL